MTDSNGFDLAGFSAALAAATRRAAERVVSVRGTHGAISGVIWATGLVVTAHEGRGVAKVLLEHTQEWAREHRCQLITLAVLPGNERARALYEADGFGTDLVRMAKPVH